MKDEPTLSKRQDELDLYGMSLLLMLWNEIFG
jgi:hypothetical protein